MPTRVDATGQGVTESYVQNLLDDFAKRITASTNSHSSLTSYEEI